MKPKKFDCVEMMHEGAEKVRKQTGGMTREGELTFWRQRSRNLRQSQNAAQGKARLGKKAETRPE